MSTSAFLLLACASTQHEFGSASRPLEVESTRAEGRNLYTLRWETPSAEATVVRYGEGGAFDHVAVGTSSEDGRRHEVVLAGLAAGLSWQVQVEGHEDDPPVEIETEALPAELPALELVGGDEELEGFALSVVFDGPQTTIVLIDREGRIVWWQQVQSAAAAFRALYDPASRSVTWFDHGDDGSSRLWRCTLDGQPEQIASLPHAHHDLTAAPDGGWYVLAYEPREMPYEGGTETVKGDEVVYVSADGSVIEQIWSSWDEFPFTGSGMWGTDGLEYPHTNSVVVDPATGDVVLSLYFADTVIAVDPEDGQTRWRMGGDASDWELDEPFARQHSPFFVDGGARLALFDNGFGDEEDPAEATLYELDWATRSARRSWAFDDGGDHFGITMGSAVPTPTDDLLVAWGSDAELTRVTEAGQVRWKLLLDGDSFGYTTLVEDLAGASW